MEIKIQDNPENVTVILSGSFDTLATEQNANMALKVAHHGYVLETGHIIMSGTGQELLNNEEIKDAYLGKSKK